MAEQLVNAYLSGEVTSLDTQLSTERVPGAAPAPEADTAGMIGVINISGGLVNRPMPGPSGGGPVSYTALRDAFDELLHDDGISAIVLRIESPGGMASGLFDLTDHIYASRGQKPIHALVDDYAYSAAYGLAAACDEIWVSRTGGAGSVGVCAFHYDWSGNDAQIGLKVTPIYAGDRKIDFNPHFPLSEEAHARALESVDATYGLFVKSVAKYRGIDEAIVRSTQADVYYGDRAVAAGLATRLGTWDDLVSHLGAPGVDAPGQAGDDDGGADSELGATPMAVGAESESDVEEVADAADAPLDPSNTDVDAPVPDEAAKLAATGAIARAVTAAGLAPDLAVALLEHVQDVAHVAREVERAHGIADLCRAANLRSLAADLIKSGASLEQARAQLDGATASVGDELVTAQPTQSTAVIAAAAKQAESLDPNRVYARRNNPRGAKK
ncbi:S49 family peptidase [Luteimonas sp. TWI662]|uniref:S49 family peptidase n=1 Tax=Luteimonas sp. TWI662 TaxID=3136789 RepID=UPI0032090198